jgi:hypothetical protein
MPEPVRFLASFPPIGSAVKLSGNGDGARIQFDIPESDVDVLRRLLDMRGIVLVVTVETEDDAIRHGTTPTSA